MKMTFCAFCISFSLLFSGMTTIVRPRPMVVVVGQSNAVRTAPVLAAMLPGVPVVNCAVGGTSIRRWQRGDDIYENCVEHVRALQNKGYRVRWMFFMQGETDANNPDVAPKWEDLFLRFIRTFRKDIGAPGMPIVYGQLGPKPTYRGEPYWKSIQRQQADAMIEHPLLRMIVTNDINPYCPSDGPHWCDDGYTVIAQRALHQYNDQFGIRYGTMGPEWQ